MNARPLLLAALVTLLASAPAIATGLAVVSPGSPSEALLVSSPWPTFSWTDPGRAEVVEVLVYPVAGDGTLPPRPVIQERLPAGARSFTPAGPRGLAPGATYAWTVRALGPEAMQASKPAFFRVAAVEPREELEEALAIIERHLVANGRSRLPAPAGAAFDGAESESVFDGAPQESAPPGEVSVDGAGGLTAAAVSVTGFSCVDCVDSSAIGVGDVSGVDIQDGTITGSDIAPQTLGAPFSNFRSGSIDGTRILDGTLTAADLGENSVGAAEIAFGAVGSSEIASDAVTSLELAVDAVAEIDIGNDAVGGAQLDDIRVVSVECFGDCSDSSLGTVCGAGYRALLVDCENIANAGAGSNCGGNNVCVQSIVADNLSLGSYCADAVGWDAHVFCLSD